MCRDIDKLKNPRLVRDALGYAALGLRVIPIGKSSKKPMIERWPERATCEPETIIRWFESWPDSNLAIVTGDGLIALDIDHRNGGKRSFKKLMKGRIFPETATAQTGSGGLHYLFRVDPNLRVNSQVFMKGIDLKGENGALLVEPSVHPTTGFEYVWLRTPRQGIADAPSWLVAVLSFEGKGRRSASPVSRDRTGSPEDLFSEMIERFPVFEQGRRNAEMVRLVGSLLGRGYGDDLIVEVGTRWWEHFYREGTIRTPPREAPTAIRASIKATLGNPDFSRSVGVDHLARCREIELDPVCQNYLTNGLIIKGELHPAHSPLVSPPGNRVHISEDLINRPLCRTSQERAFVEAWAVYVTYKLTVVGESPLKMTRDQIRRIMEDRRGVRVENTQFEHLKRRYISREGKPASVFELAVQTSAGSPGIPSEFNPTGILQLLELAFPENVAA